ncbi:MAG TPA: nucleoside-diphosphate sugar epimerase/dehydratase [Thermoanaerobaculia bacterium]|nr:nucleoside-diphosphate sugar epimerase/dehydratase [Thermoanaerobaculia bacterium]
MRTQAARVFVLFCFHAMVFTACYALAWQVRFEFDIAPEFDSLMLGSFPVVVGAQLLAGVFFSLYAGWWRYVGITDVVRLVAGLTAALGALVTGWYLSDLLNLPHDQFKPPRGVLLIDWAFALLMLFGARVAVRLGRDGLRGVTAEGVTRVLIIGAGDSGETLAREIEHRPQLGMKVVAFVDDHRVKFGASIRGIRVLGPISNVASIADSSGAEEALIAIPSATGERMREIIHHLSAADLKFKTVPGIDQLVSGQVHVTQLRPVNVEDMLRRGRIELPGDPVRKLFSGKRVLVTGAGGTVGAELAAQIAKLEPARLALVERSEYALYEIRRRLQRDVAWASEISANLLDICDTDVFEELLERERPEVILHSAAHKHVPLGEENPAEYLRNNTLATRSIAEIAARRGVDRFVLISTDKAINPTSVMGASKRAAEILLLDIARRTQMKATVVRFGNVIGSSGSVIPLFLEQIAAGGPVTVTHPEVTRYFIRTSEAISLVLQAATLGNAGQIFMLDMGEPVKILELARDLIQVSNRGIEIPIKFIGLRPGEKLVEEIRLDSESARPTVHPQIVVTEAAQPDAAQVETWTRRATSVRDHDGAVTALRAIVPEYQPRNVATEPSSEVVPLRRVTGSVA